MELSKIFNVTLDELTGNDVNKIINNRIENTEDKIKKANFLVRVFIVIGISVLMFVIYIFVLFNLRSKQRKIMGSYDFICNVEESYKYGIEFNKNYQIIYTGGDSYIDNHTDTEKYDDANQVKAHIEIILETIVVHVL